MSASSGAKRDGGEPATTARSESRRTRLACLAVLALVVAFSSWARIHYTLADRNFDAQSPDAVLRSDPALLYYVTERIVDAGGLPPADFRADPRVTWPEPADLPAMFTVGQEFLIAWAHLAFGGDGPLHVTCLWVMSIVASLAAVGVFGLAYELTRSSRWAALAAALFALVPANYRTLGVLLLREDLSLPAFVAHLWLVSRAARTHGFGSWIAAGLALALALATWHAMAFVVTLEVAALLAWFLRTGESPFDRSRAWIVPALAAAAALIVPVLWAKRFLFSPAMLATLALAAVSVLDRRRAWSHARRALVALALLAAALAGVRLSGAQRDYGHVFEFLAAKLAHLGAFPQDPASVGFDVRLLWQGPFATASLRTDVIDGLGGAALAAAAAILVAVPGWWRGRGDRRFLVLVGLCAISAFAGWLVSRTLVLLALLAPALFAALASRPKRAAIGVALALAFLTLQTGQSVQRVRAADGELVGWYANWPGRNAELAHLVRWARASLAPDEGVLSDYVTSTALLVASRSGIVCQPKYETAASRRRIEEFCAALLRGAPAELGALAKRYRCRYVVIDRISGWLLLGYPAGYPLSLLDGLHAPPAGTALAAIDAGGVLPGLRLVYSTPPRLVEMPAGMRSWCSYRVYEVE